MTANNPNDEAIRQLTQICSTLGIDSSSLLNSRAQVPIQMVQPQAPQLLAPQVSQPLTSSSQLPFDRPFPTQVPQSSFTFRAPLNQSSSTSHAPQPSLNPLPPSTPSSLSSHAFSGQAPSNPPPVFERYESLRPGSSQAGPSTLQVGSGSGSFQPFAGISSLGRPLSTEHVNQARMASSSSLLPRGQPLPRRGRRRGSAVHAPSIPHPPRPPTWKDCVSNDGIIRLNIKVYPPVVSQSCLVLQKLADSYDIDPGKAGAHHLSLFQGYL